MVACSGHPFPLLPFFAIAEMLAIASVALMSVYVWVYGGKKPMNWETNSGNYHPLFMTIGLIFCYSQGMLVFRVLRNGKKLTLKFIHFGIQATAFVFVVLGLQAEFHSNQGGKQAHSLHSWMGLGTVALFACQLLWGFLTYLLLPLLESKLPLRIRGILGLFRQFYLPIHVFFGVGIFSMAVGTALMGVTEKIMFSGFSDFSTFQPKTTVLKCFGLVLVLLAMCLVYIVANHKFKRIPHEEERLITNASAIQTDDKMEAQRIY